MAGVPKGEWSLDRLGELQPKKRADRACLPFATARARAMELDSAAKPTPDMPNLSSASTHYS